MTGSQLSVRQVLCFAAFICFCTGAVAADAEVTQPDTAVPAAEAEPAQTDSAAPTADAGETQAGTATPAAVEVPEVNLKNCSDQKLLETILADLKALEAQGNYEREPLVKMRSFTEQCLVLLKNGS